MMAYFTGHFRKHQMDSSQQAKFQKRFVEIYAFQIVLDKQENYQPNLKIAS